MERLSDDGVIAAASLRRIATGSDDAPQAPLGVLDAGLPETFVEALVLKHVDAAGDITSGALAQRLAVPYSVFESVLVRLRASRCLDVPRRGRFDAETSWALTEGGRMRAQEAMRRCAYLGPMPVPWDDYLTRVRSQALADIRIDAVCLRERLGDAVVPEHTFEALGTALNSDRALLLYGPSGSGKTYLAERLGAVFQDPIWVPHAVFVEGEVIQIFDARVHRRMEAPVALNQLERAVTEDARWVHVRRPVVMVGGELSLERLELQLDSVTRFYVAPPQVQAMNGVLVIDDLGRQRVAARDLINRWIVPLDRGSDELVLHTGTRLQLPFDVKVVFSSNMSPHDLGDPAFLRRLGYTIPIGGMTQSDYHAVIGQACARLGLGSSTRAVCSAFDGLHESTGTPRYPALPDILLRAVRDRAVFRGERVVPDAAALAWAWSLCGSKTMHSEISVGGQDQERHV